MDVVFIPADPAVGACGELIDGLLLLHGIQVRRAYGDSWEARLDNGDGTFQVVTAYTFQDALKQLGLLEGPA